MVHVLGTRRLLRGHVAGRPHDFLGLGGEFRAACRAATRVNFRPSRHNLRQAEICHLHPSAPVEQEVLGLDVTVDDSVVVRELERVADLRHDGQRLARRHPARAQELAQVDAIHELHQEEVQPLGASELVEGDDVRVVELGQGSGFPGEPLGKRRRVTEAGRQDFQRHGAVEFALTGLVDRAHPAIPDEFEHFQPRKLAGQFRGRWRHELCRGCHVRECIGRRALL